MTTTRNRRHIRQLLGIALLLVGAAAMAGAAFSGGTSANAASANLRVDPATQTVAPDAQFTVLIKQNADVATSGAQMNFHFDPLAAQLVSIQKGSIWGSASLVMGVVPQTAAEAIAEANTTGELKNAAVFFLPGGGSVGAGDQTSFAVTMKAKPAVNRLSPLTLSRVTFLDNSGNVIASTGTDGSVQVGDPTLNPTATPSPTATGVPTETPSPTETSTSTPTATNTAGPSPTGTNTSTSTSTATFTTTPATSTPTLTPTPSPTSTSTTPTATWTIVVPTATTTPANIGSMKLTPEEQTLPPGAAFTINLAHDASFAASGAETDLVFDAALVQIDRIEKAPAYSGAQGPLAGVQQTMAEAIAEANTTGRLKKLSVFYLPGSGQAAPGVNGFVVVKMKAKTTDGQSAIKLEEVALLDLEGEQARATGAQGKVIIQTGAVIPTPVPPPVAVGSGAAAGAGTSSSVLGTGRSSSGTAVRPGALPRTGDGDGFGAGSMLVFVIGLTVFATGGVVTAGGFVRRRTP